MLSSLNDPRSFKKKFLRYAAREKYFAILDSNQFYEGKDLSLHPYAHDYELLAAIGAKRILKADAGCAFEKLKEFRAANPGWLFGYFGYDLKNEIEAVGSSNPDFTGMPDLFFFLPQTLVVLRKGDIEIIDDEKDAAAILEEIQSESDDDFHLERAPIRFNSRIHRTEYIQNVKKIQQHILEGDIYEMNFCQEFYGENISIDPITVFDRLKQHSPQPFSALLKLEDKYIICASMERFLKKKEDKLLSQPIKGTIRRGADREENNDLKQQLIEDEKERAENVMIVDLVRNDLTRYARTGSIRVEELFGIYEFPFVNHMISSVSSRLRNAADGLEALKAAFPMGSMTGAPKVMAMKLIDDYEKSRRGAYSGALGYFDDRDDFDFNVMIRTFIYNASTGYLSIHAGSAITYDSVPEKEYEECLLKIRALIETLQAKTE